MLVSNHRLMGFCISHILGLQVAPVDFVMVLSEFFTLGFLGIGYHAEIRQRLVTVVVAALRFLEPCWKRAILFPPDLRILLKNKISNILAAALHHDCPLSRHDTMRINIQTYYYHTRHSSCVGSVKGR